jgi:soluble lytic murein transglycosylase
MPDDPFLSPTKLKATPNQIASLQATEHYNKPHSILSDTPDSIKNISGMQQRVINFDSEKLTIQRQQFLKAERALRQHRLRQFRKILSTLEEYPLYPYLRYQYLKQRIGRVKSKELTQFFADYESQPVASMFRSKLLKHSARHGRWKRFLTFYTPQNNVKLQCHYLNALIRTGQAEAAYPKIKAMWLKGKSQPRSCDRVFKHWRVAGNLTPELVWQRMELALDKRNRSLATYLVRSLPARDRKLARLWIKLHRKPALLPKYQARLVKFSHAMTPKILTSIAKRFASRNPQQAIKLLFKADINYVIAQEDHFDVLQTLAISLSRKHLPGAEFWFSHIPDQYLSDVGREWRIRTALRESQWQTALAAINSLSLTKMKSDRWTFWRARTHEELGELIPAMRQYTALAQRRSYYGFLAADRLGRAYTITDRPHLPTTSELFLLGQRADIKRAHELLKLGRIVSARREWREVTQSMNNDERIDASKLAQLWGWAEQSILTMASTTSRDDMDLRFPLLFQEQVLSHSENESIDPAWTYGVIRRESAFVRDARSPVGAVGLMQLMPATAKHVSRRHSNVKYRSSSQLTHADTNLALGTRYLKGRRPGRSTLDRKYSF